MNLQEITLAEGYDFLSHKEHHQLYQVGEGRRLRNKVRKPLPVYPTSSQATLNFYVLALYDVE